MPTTVVADVGGTTSRWGVLTEDRSQLVLDGLPGFNPAVGEPDVFASAVRARFQGLGIDVADLFVYGAGCGSPDRCSRMAETLLSVFPGARVDVASDLMGAAHGLLGVTSGLVLILGTGMNAGYYDGALLHQPMPSLGYLLGDEGSGADIGKHFLHDALHGRVPRTVIRSVFPEGIELASIIEHVYRGTGPQAWLAAFAGKLAAMRSDNYVSALVQRRFNALAELLTLHFGDRRLAPVQATGSVAYGYREELARALARSGFSLSGAAPSPLEGLLRYRSGAGR